MSDAEKGSLYSCDGWIQEERKKGSGKRILWCQLLQRQLASPREKHCTSEQLQECLQVFASAQLRSMTFWDGGNTDVSHGENIERAHAGSDEQRTYEEGRFSDKE